MTVPNTSAVAEVSVAVPAEDDPRVIADWARQVSRSNKVELRLLGAAGLDAVERDADAAHLPDGPVLWVLVVLDEGGLDPVSYPPLVGAPIPKRSSSCTE